MYDIGEEVVEHAGEASRLQQMIEVLMKREAAVTAADAALKEAKAEYNKIAMEDMPELMIELGIVGLELDDGRKARLNEEISTAITAKNAQKAFNWLRENNFGGLIKAKVEIEEDDIPKEKYGEDVLGKFAIEHNGHVIEKIHPGTLKSFIKEQMEVGADIPLELFSVHAYKVVKLTKR